MTNSCYCITVILIKPNRVIIKMRISNIISNIQVGSQGKIRKWLNEGLEIILVILLPEEIENRIEESVDQEELVAPK